MRHDPMRLVTSLLAVLWIACGAESTTLLDKGRANLASLVSAGESYEICLSRLERADVLFNEIPAAHCTGIWMRPEFECKGGPAIRVVLEANSDPYDLMWLTDTVAFLPFDDSRVLRAPAVALSSGPRW